jgi:hypothetical protein
MKAAIIIVAVLSSVLASAHAADVSPTPQKLPNFATTSDTEIIGECDLKPGESKAFTFKTPTPIKIGFDSKLARPMTEEDWKTHGPVRIRFIRTDGGEGGFENKSGVYGKLEPKSGQIQFKIENGLPIQAKVFVFVRKAAD